MILASGINLGTYLDLNFKTTSFLPPPSLPKHHRENAQNLELETTTTKE
jgi:hypothetical protein